MKKKILYFVLLFAFLTEAVNANAIQPKSSDYIVIPEEIAQTHTVIPAVIAKDEPLEISYDNISEFGNYLKIKVDGKYGVIDKEGNVILAPVFQRVGIIDIDSQECFAAKVNGKYRFYYNTGKLIPEDKLYPVTQNSSMLLAKNLKPQFIAAVRNNNILYKKSEYGSENKNLVYEIKEIPVIKASKIVKVAQTEKNQTNLLNYVNKTNSSDLFTLNKKQFYIVKEGKKLGINDTNNKVIVPAQYDAFNIVTPCSHFKNPVFLVSDKGIYSIYDINGNILAEQVYGKINVYRNGKVYTYSVENGKGILKEGTRELGEFVKSQDGFKYTPKGFSIIRPHIVNNLVITILNVLK